MRLRFPTLPRLAEVQFFSKDGPGPRLAPDCYDLKNPPTRPLPMGEELEKHRNGIEFQFHGQSRREVSFRAAARTSSSPRSWRSPGKRTGLIVTLPGIKPCSPRTFATRVTKETVLPLLIEMCVFISPLVKRKHAAPLGRESYIAVTLPRNEQRLRQTRPSNRGTDQTSSCRRALAWLDHQHEHHRDQRHPGERAEGHVQRDIVIAQHAKTHIRESPKADAH
jgi:hypothetical protein